MKVKQGWSGEVESNKWAKVGVELDEDDLGRLLRQHGITTNPSDVPLMMAFSILELMTERLVLLKLMVRHGYPQDQGVKELEESDLALKSLMDQVRSAV
jgi:hypothetical protein